MHLYDGSSLANGGKKLRGSMSTYGGKYFAGKYPTGSMAAARMFIWNNTPNLQASIAQSILVQSLPTDSLEAQTYKRRYANKQYELSMLYTSMQPFIAPFRVAHSSPYIALQVRKAT